MPTDPEMRRLYLAAHRANKELVNRLETYNDLVPARPEEIAIADEVAAFALFVERQFRGWYERSRDVREMLENPDVRDFPGPREPDPDPRDE